jgi:hypothetical protein
MIRRRITGFLVSLLLFHLTWIGNDPACGDQTDGAAATTATPGDATHHHGAASSDDTRAPAPVIPGPRQCCAAMASCAVALIAAHATERVDPAASEGNALATSTHAPALGIRAPEPPPPKA